MNRPSTDDKARSSFQHLMRPVVLWSHSPQFPISAFRHVALRSLKRWSEGSHAAAFLIPTGPFHSRRVRWVFRKAFRDAPARLAVTSIAPEQCQSWWKKEQTLIDFQNEVVKSGFYHVRY